jgi:hypothetical protein
MLSDVNSGYMRRGRGKQQQETLIYSEGKSFGGVGGGGERRKSARFGKLLDDKI